MHLPESPRWLVMQGRNEEALEILEALNEKSRDDPYIKNELISIQETVMEMSKGSFRSLFAMSEYREFHRVALAYVNQMFQQVSESTGSSAGTYTNQMFQRLDQWNQLDHLLCKIFPQL